MDWLGEMTQRAHRWKTEEAEGGLQQVILQTEEGMKSQNGCSKLFPFEKEKKKKKNQVDRCVQT